MGFESDCSYHDFGSASRERSVNPWCVSQSVWELMAQEAYQPAHVTSGTEPREIPKCKATDDLPSFEFAEMQHLTRGIGSFVEGVVDTVATQAYFDDLFKRFDVGEKGYLSHADIVNALKDQTLCGYDVRVLKRLRDDFSSFAGLSDDEILFERNLYLNDLKQFVHLFEVNNQWDKSQAFFKEHWNTLTQDNHDDVVTKENVQAIMSEGRIDGKPLSMAEMESLQTLLDNWRSIADPDFTTDEYLNPSISDFDIYRFDPVAEIL